MVKLFFMGEDIGHWINICLSYTGDVEEPVPLESGPVVPGPFYWITFSEAYQELIWLLDLFVWSGIWLRTCIDFEVFFQGISYITMME